MAKTEEELKLLKEKVDALVKELKELSEDELRQVAGGVLPENLKWDSDWGESGYFRH